jgi:hypothetical protein
VQDRRQNGYHHLYTDDGRKPRRIRRLRASVMGAGCPHSQATYRDIEQTRGAVPTFFKLFPESGIAGA